MASTTSSPRVFRQALNDPTRGVGSDTMSEMMPSYNSKFPFNNVLVYSESGHMIEVDDTPGAERVHVFHRSGSHIELRPDGSAKYKTVNRRQDVTIGDSEVIIQGDWKITTDGAIKMYARNGSLEIQADNGAALNVKGELKLHADNILLKAKNKISLAAPFVDIGSPTYLSLPTQIAPLFGVPVPYVKLALNETNSLSSLPKMGTGVDQLAAVVTFAKKLTDTMGNFSRIAKSSKFSPNEILAKLPDGTPQLPEIAQPEEISLSCPALYKGITETDIKHRDRQLDTPDDVNDTETYSAHLSICNELGDFNE